MGEPQREFLERVLARAAARGDGRSQVVVLLDLDSTLYDNRPRTLRILQEWAAGQSSRPELQQKIRSIRPEAQAYRLGQTLARAGIEDPAIHDEIAAFWNERFFTDAYCLDDVPTAGAVEYARELHTRGLFLVYLTGRDVPGMLVGTIGSLRRDGFPIGLAGTMLVMKPDFDTPDAVFKRDVLDHVAAIGDPVAAFDNEPENCNLFAARFPGCLVAFLDTMHSADAPELHPDVAILRDFTR